jgi:membrane protease YdiL (CAAX protease family)
MPMEPMRRRDAVLLTVAVEGGLLVLALLLGWLLGQSPLGQIHGNVHDVALGLAATLPLLIAFWAFVRRPIGPLARIKQLSGEFIAPFFQNCTIADLALIALVAGLGEETLFRGVLQGAVGLWLGTGAGLAAVSILFGVLHMITPTYALLAALCGLYLGVLMVLADNLVVVVVPHALYDFIALLYITRRLLAEPRV